MENNNCKDIYIKFSNVLSGCRTLYDALYFAQFYIKNNPEHKTLINSMIHGKHYEKITDFRRMANILKMLNNFQTRNEIDTYINTSINKDNLDYSQLNALLRLGKNKTYIKQNNNEDVNIVTENINKNLVSLIDKNLNNDNDDNNLNEDIDKWINQGLNQNSSDLDKLDNFDNSV